MIPKCQIKTIQISSLWTWETQEIEICEAILKMSESWATAKRISNKLDQIPEVNKYYNF